MLGQVPYPLYGHHLSMYSSHPWSHLYLFEQTGVFSQLHMWARCVERVGEDCVCARAKSDGYADCECSWVPEATKTCKHMSICIINSTRGVVYEGRRVYMQLCACDEQEGTCEHIVRQRPQTMEDTRDFRGLGKNGQEKVAYRGGMRKP